MTTDSDTAAALRALLTLSRTLADDDPDHIEYVGTKCVLLKRAHDEIRRAIGNPLDIHKVSRGLVAGRFISEPRHTMRTVDGVARQYRLVRINESLIRSELAELQIGSTSKTTKHRPASDEAASHDGAADDIAQQ